MLRKTTERTRDAFAKREKFDRKISDIFSQDVFDPETMRAYITEDAYRAVIAAKLHSKKIDAGTVGVIAKGMKKWAIDKGATHYTHWFQPMTGGTAEKHDAFYKPSADTSGIEDLTGAELMQGEPDASSFPSGGLRSTNAARGYTIWDPTSPTFILDSTSGKTLYIPSVFISYTGEALGYKIPLLRSIEAISNAATAVYHYFDDTAKRVSPNLGWEQEYFAVDAHLYQARPDLLLTGRTLFGRKSPKGQELDDHYFGVIPERVQAFMHDFEQEALKLGIPVLTRHNEVAPNQFECAPMFEELSLSNDHNMLVMHIMQKVARKHDLRILMHEKPFAGLNGSGKHNNWSMATDTGVNLLSGGDQPGNNLRFITFFVAVVKAISVNADLLRASITGAGNDYRLGANEAPPAIISVFTGLQIEQLLNDFQERGLNADGPEGYPKIELNIPKIPAAVLDNTDRNRTSPFPFIGNRFEFRAVGSTQNCSLPMMVLNTIVADQLTAFKKEVDLRIEGGEEKEEAITAVVQSYIKDCRPIIFNGDGYSEAWEAEAKKRGLANIKATPYALDALMTDQTKSLFERNHILNRRELEARYKVLQEIYVNKIAIEAALVKEIAYTHIIPAAVNYQSRLMDLFNGYREMEIDTSEVKQQVREIQSHIQGIRANVTQMEVAKEQLHATHNAVSEVAKGLHDTVKPYFDTIRAHADELEVLVDDSCWKLPKYRELLRID